MTVRTPSYLNSQEFTLTGATGRIVAQNIQDLVDTVGAMAGTGDLTTVTAAVGTATALTTYNSLVTTVPQGSGVALQNLLNIPQTVFSRGANSLNLYPPNSSISIESQAPGAPLVVGVGTNVTVVVVSSTQAYVLNLQTQAGGIPQITTPYGVPAIGDDLANTSLTAGGDANGHFAASIRFQSPTSSTLSSVRIYLQTKAAGTGDPNGYGGGTGGTLRMQVCNDDGTSNHLPVTATPLASVDIPGAGSPATLMTTVTLSSPPSLSAGSLYHLYFNNVDPSPNTNFMDINSIYFDTAGSAGNGTGLPWSGGYTNFALLMKDTSGAAWAVRPGFNPTLEAHFSDNTIWGSGFMGFTSAARSVSGVNQIREVINATQTRTVNGVRVGGFHGSGTPTCRFETGAGTLIDQGTMTDDPTYGSTSGWHCFKFDFAAARTISSGSTYHVVLSAASGTLTINAVRKGSKQWGFNAAVCFPDGSAQFSTNSGSTWTDNGLSQYGLSAEDDWGVVFY